MDWDIGNLLIILVIALIIFGAGKLPEIGSGIGSARRFSVRGDAAEITRNGKAARYSELKPSDRIQV